MEKEVSTEKPAVHRLSWVNIGLYIAAAVFFIVIYIKADLLFSSYQVGRLIGTLIFLLLIPLFFSKLAWKFSKHKDRSARITFNFVIIFAALSSFSQLLEGTGYIERHNNIIEKQHILEYVKRNSDDPYEINKARAALNEAVMDDYKSRSKKNEDLVNRLENVQFEFLKEVFQRRKQWEATFAALPDLSGTDISHIKNVTDYHNNISVINTYIEATQVFKKQMQNIESDYKNRFTTDELNEKIVQATLESVETGINEQRPTLYLLLNAHIKYGNDMLTLFKLLHDNHEKWDHKDNEIIVNDQELLKEVSSLYDAINQSLNNIDELNKQLLPFQS